MLRQYLSRLERWHLLLAVPVAAFVVTFGVTLATGGDEPEDEPAGSQQVAAENVGLLVTPTTAPLPTATLEPTATQPPPNREDCDAIEGTDYQSPEERDWYLANCNGGGGSSASASGGGQGAPAYTGPATVGAAEFALGDRLIIPAAGVNASVTGSVVGGSGQMTSPVGYFNAVWYDFSGFPGIGGYVDSGNLVVAGHVDCARCHNGASGGAVFYNIRNLKAGDSIQYVTAAGQTVSYVVTGAYWYEPTANWAAVLSSGAADLSIVTCIGTFDTSRHEYTHRLVVYADKTGG
jgi:hypothetical protein